MRRSVFNNQKGQAIVLTSALCLLLITLLGLVVDMGNLYLQKTKLQTAVDAAALAGALSLPGNTAKAKDAANQYMLNNGVTTAGNKTYSVNFAESNTKIIVTLNQDVPTYFLRVIGTKTVAVGASATAWSSGGSGGGPFGYGIFSGAKDDTLRFNGSHIVKGSVHSNSDLLLNGSPEISGSAEAVGRVTQHGNGSIGSVLNGAAVMDMPDLSGTIQAEAQAAGRVYNGNQAWGGNGTANGYTFVGPTYVNGSVALNSTTVIAGTGALVAKGSIAINGNTLSRDASQQVCFYSTDGDITINGSAGPVQAVFYAPKGEVRINGSLNLNGSIIAKYVTINGSATINSTDYPVTSLPVGGHVRLIK